MKSLRTKTDLEQLNLEALELFEQHSRKDTACCQIIRQSDPKFTHLSDEQIFEWKFSLDEARRVLAEAYGYSDWQTLEKYILQIKAPIYNNVSDKIAYHKVITDSYDERSKRYDDSQWHRQIALQTVDYCPPEIGHQVLDVATGTGSIAFYAAELVGESGSVVGVDISHGMLNKCVEKNSALSFKNLEFLCADGEHLPFADSSFDRIYCTSAIFWMSNTLATLRHWCELLRPGGHIGFNATPSKSFFWGHGARLVLEKYGVSYICNIPAGDYEDAKALIHLAGLENFRFYEENKGHFIALKDALGPPLTTDAYAPGQFPHPMENISDEVKSKMQKDFESELLKRNTPEGIWHDTTQYFIFGQKPG